MGDGIRATDLPLVTGVTELIVNYDDGGGAQTGRAALETLADALHIAGYNLYNLKLTYPGIPSNNAMILGEVFDLNIQFPANFSGSQFRCKVAPNEAYTINVKKNGSIVGAIRFAAGETVATFTTSSGLPVYMTTGDVLELVTQSALDVISGIFGTLQGWRI